MTTAALPAPQLLQGQVAGLLRWMIGKAEEDLLGLENAN